MDPGDVSRLKLAVLTDLSEHTPALDELRNADERRLTEATDVPRLRDATAGAMMTWTLPPQRVGNPTGLLCVAATLPHAGRIIRWRGRRTLLSRLEGQAVRKLGDGAVVSFAGDVGDRAAPGDPEEDLGGIAGHSHEYVVGDPG